MASHCVSAYQWKLVFFNETLCRVISPHAEAAGYCGSFRPGLHLFQVTTQLRGLVNVHNKTISSPARLESSYLRNVCADQWGCIT